MDQRAVIGAYEVQCDPKILRREGRLLLRKRTLRITLGGVLVGLLFAFASCFLVAFWWISDRTGNQSYALWSTLGFAVFLGIVATWSYCYDQVERAVKVDLKAQRWTTRILESGLETEQANGIVLIIPWRLMTITAERDDVWMIEYEGNPLAVFRKPMREAGLDEEFRRRVEGAKS